MAKTTVEIRREVLERFPHFTLVDYRGNDYPVRIRCPKHGLQVISRYSNFIRSECGCPACANEVRVAALERGQRNAKELRKKVTELLPHLQTHIMEDAAPEKFKEVVEKFLKSPS